MHMHLQVQAKLTGIFFSRPGALAPRRVSCAITMHAFRNPLASLTTTHRRSATHSRPRQLIDLVSIFSPCQQLRFDLSHIQAKYYLQLNIFMASISFIDQLYMFVLLFRSLPLNMLGGLTMPTRRSPDLRV
jgi:hypothetical protein